MSRGVARLGVLAVGAPPPAEVDRPPTSTRVDRGARTRYAGNPSPASASDNLLATLLLPWRSRVRDLLALERFWRDRALLAEALLDVDGRAALRRGARELAEARKAVTP